MSTLRPIAFVLASTNHGTMLVNRNDYVLKGNAGYGMGFQLFNTSSFDPTEVGLAIQLLMSRRASYGDGVVAIDCGANVGVHTIEWAKAMYGWGDVISFEAQERIYYALAGNVAMNNCFNARPIFAAVGAHSGSIPVPSPNYLLPSSFGSLEIRKTATTEFIGQDVDYRPENCIQTRLMSIDELNLKRLDFIKIDIEGMEMDALIGAENSINQHRPQMLIEKIKSNENDIRHFLTEHGYKVMAIDINLLAIHSSDPASIEIK
ncbi:FkbM family methyltransferase [Jezberella montanilacus]|nr:FkbM family methyltransferase [Jezberella montanilacus]